MLTYLVSGAMIGLMGSFHCVGMCGPLALSLPIQHAEGTQKTVYAALYNLGRAATYALLGAIFGGLGKQLEVFGFQQYLSIFAGVFLLLMWVGLPYLQAKNTQYKQYNFWIKQQLSTLLQSKTKAASTYFMIGAVNGLLPCGLVYVAIAAAVATGSWIGGAMLMFSFGLGTLPALFALMMAGNYISLPVRQKLNRLTPIFTVGLAVLLILRGLNLGVPYISPAFSSQNKCVKHCCH